MFHLSLELARSIQEDRMREAKAARAALHARRVQKGRLVRSPALPSQIDPEPDRPVAVATGHPVRPVTEPARNSLVEIGWKVAADGLDAHRAEIEQLTTMAFRRGAPAAIVSTVTDPSTATAPRLRAFAALVGFLLGHDEEKARADVAS